VRSLAADLGTALGGGAHLQRLRRLAIGPFREPVPLDDVGLADVLPPVEAFRGRPRVVVDKDVAAAVGHGKVLPRATLGAEGDGPWAVLSGDGRLLAVYEAHRDETVKPAVVLA
jgi:tRNA pseudouridine55 synthase